MVVVNMVEKFGVDDVLERSWELPPDVVEPLRTHVDVAPGEWVVNSWPMTAQLASIVQPWVDEPIDLTTNSWFVSSAQATA
ncbi:hypothetical protein [Micromonospora lupini]|uniref:Uncharacterized protein n=1 Tax=Micromonospora lupini str. Lupac 08 TaxID=1150864 RepID=I0L062_9ACTN|nr:hypothetical protein [Micromonospora lupini]CCH17209.1 hypothetical protein MILUP08_42129 [Micromonospora lupini str. Lupac 08]